MAARPRLIKSKTIKVFDDMVSVEDFLELKTVFFFFGFLLLCFMFAKSFINHIFSIGDIPRRSRPFEMTCLTDNKHARIDSIFWSVSERT